MSCISWSSKNLFHHTHIMLPRDHLSLPVRHHPHQYVPKQPFEPSLYTSWRPCTLNCKPLKTLYWCILGVWHVIECQVIQGCEVGITVRHNDNVDFLRLFCVCFYCLQTFNPSAHVWWHIEYWTMHITMTVTAWMPSWLHSHFQSRHYFIRESHH